MHVGVRGYGDLPPGPGGRRVAVAKKCAGRRTSAAKDGASAGFDPTQWAESRRMKIERAQQLRAEQRARLQAMGQLPLDTDNLGVPGQGANRAQGIGGQGPLAEPRCTSVGGPAPRASSQQQLSQQPRVQQHGRQEHAPAARVAPAGGARPPPWAVDDPCAPSASSEGASARAPQASKRPSLVAPYSWEPTETEAAEEREAPSECSTVPLPESPWAADPGPEVESANVLSPPWADEPELQQESSLQYGVPTEQPVIPVGLDPRSGSLTQVAGVPVVGYSDSTIRWPMEEVPEAALHSPSSAEHGLAVEGQQPKQELASMDHAPDHTLATPLRLPAQSASPKQSDRSAQPQPGHNTQQDLAELFQQAFAVGACQDASDHLAEDSAEATLVPRSVDEVTLPRGGFGDLAAAVKAARPPLPRPAAAAVAKLPTAEPPPVDQFQQGSAPMRSGDDATDAEQPPEATLLQPMSVASPPHNGRGRADQQHHMPGSTNGTDLTALFDVAYHNHAGDTRSSGLPCDARTLDLRWCSDPADPSPLVEDHRCRDFADVARTSQEDGCSSPRYCSPVPHSSPPAVAGDGAEFSPERTAPGQQCPSQMPEVRPDAFDPAEQKHVQQAQLSAYPGGRPQPSSIGCSPRWRSPGDGGTRKQPTTPLALAESSGDGKSGPENSFRVIEFADVHSDGDGPVDASTDCEFTFSLAGDGGPKWLRELNREAGPKWLRQMEPASHPNREANSEQTTRPSDWRQAMPTQEGNQRELSARLDSDHGIEIGADSAAHHPCEPQEQKRPSSQSSHKSQQPFQQFQPQRQHQAVDRGAHDDWQQKQDRETHETEFRRHSTAFESDSQKLKDEGVVAQWLNNLRGVEDDLFVSDDPLVFGEPKPVKKKTKALKPRAQPVNNRDRSDESSEATPVEVESEENLAWIQGLRDIAMDEDSSIEDPLCFGKPRSKPKPGGPLQSRRAAPKRPPRPDCSSSAADCSTSAGSVVGESVHSKASGSGSRPSSGGNLSGGRSSSSMSGLTDALHGEGRPQMPDDMKRRFDQRSEHREQRRLEHKSQPHRFDQRSELREQRRPEHKSQLHRQGKELGANADSNVRDANLFANGQRGRVATAPNLERPPLCEPGSDSENGVRLPPLEPDGNARCRRSSSQPPLESAACGGYGGGAGAGIGNGGGYVDPAGVHGKPKNKKQGRAQSQSSATRDDDKCGRQMFDKNTLRTMHRDMFKFAVRQFRHERGLDTCEDDTCDAAASDDSGSKLQVYMRMRPIFEKEEKQRGDYQVTSTVPSAGVPTQVILHNCLFQADLKTPYISHLTFEFDRVFGDQAENEDVYRTAAAHLVRSSLDGGVSTMFMFGQTGSGKTHTMTAIQEFAAQDLFRGADGEEPWLSVQFVELRGNRCFDLLAPGVGDGKGARNLRPELRLREQTDGSYAADGAIYLFPKTPEELNAVMQMAQSRRATSATDANSVSSRSHAVCTLRLFQTEGQLMLVDCAGTERRKDSMYHSKERQVEGAEINASLHALKECIRHLATQQRVPSHAYRASSLTKILADAFIRCGEARMAVICTSSPCATDTEHTLATMRMGMALGGRGNEREEKQLLSDIMNAQKKPRLVHPKQWTAEQVCNWVANLNGGSFSDVADALPSNFTGQMLVRLTETRCVQLCGGSERRGRLFFDLLHQEIQRVQASHKNH